MNRDATLPFLPYGRQCLDEADIAAVVAVLRGEMLTTGPNVERFEQAAGRRLGAPHAVSCANATAALHIAAMVLGLGPGDKAIVPSVTFVATANAVRYVGADVVFADVDPATGLMGVEQLERAFGRAGGPVKAVFPVHLNGQCEDMPALRAVCAAHGASVVEDACHALGADYAAPDGGRSIVGACADSDMAIFSFHPVKMIAAGEGGLVTTRDPALAERLKLARAHGIVRDPALFENRARAFGPDGLPAPWYYEMQEPGFNYRLSDIHCALALSQLKKLDAFVAARRAMADRYAELLPAVGRGTRPLGRVPTCRSAWHLAVGLFEFDTRMMSRARVMNGLRALGVGTQVHYVPVHTQPYYERLYGKIDLPGAEAYYARCLSLPLFVGMRPDDVDRVVDAIRAVVDA